MLAKSQRRSAGPARIKKMFDSDQSKPKPSLDRAGKIRLLDLLEYNWLRQGLLSESFAIEKYADFEPERRWREIAGLIARGEISPPAEFLFLTCPDPDWQLLDKLLTSDPELG